MSRPGGRSASGVPGGKAGVPSDSETAQLESVAKWTLREAALREQLQRRMAQVEASRREEAELRQSLKLLEDAYSECRGERFDIISDFTRQYKSTLEELVRVVVQTDSTKTELSDQRELSSIALVETQKEKEHALSLLDRSLEEQARRISEMDEEFGLMLSEMKQRMEKKVREAAKAAQHAQGGGGGSDSDDSAEGEAVAGAAAGAGGGSRAAAAGH